ncbi:ubiquitin carboxyl-terminal hydrolase 35 [Lepeophtheirus salmonis]|nr:ubiquitin carboxyl-terminal hydrolase 35-like [Lepeophtheirus salmonis]
MDKIGRGIANSPNYDDTTKEELFKSLFENPDSSVSSVDTLKVLLEWALSESDPLLIKIGHRFFGELSLKHPSLFFEVIGPKFAVDLFDKHNYKNKADILIFTKTILDILDINHGKDIISNQENTERAIINIIKCRIPLFIKENGYQLSVLSSAFDLFSVHNTLITRSNFEPIKFIVIVVKFMAGYKYSESNLEEYQKVGKLFSLMFDSCQDKFNEVLKALYAIVYSSDSYDQPSPCLMLIFDKIPSAVLYGATDYFVNDSRNPQGEARVVGALQTMISWLTSVPNLFVSSWIMVLLESLKDAKRFPVLVELTHSSIEKLCFSLCEPSLCSSIEKIFFFFLMGFQHSETTFHRLISPLQQVLPKLCKNEDCVNLYESLAQAILYFIRLYPNYPGLYEPLMSFIEQKSKIHSLDDTKYYEFKKLSWIDKTESPESMACSRISMLGLLNLGNTCYMNSILQSLFLTKQFTDSILKSPVTASQVVLHRLQLVFAFLRLSMRSYYSPGDFLKVGRPPWFEPGRQQDCSEFLKYLLDTLHETEKNSRKNVNSSAFGDKLGRDMSENLRSYSTSALNSIEENDQEPEPIQETDQTPTFDIGGSISSFCPSNQTESDSDFAMGSSNSLQSYSNDMRRWTTQENLSLTEEELTEEENDSGIQSVVDSISGSSDSMQQSEEFVSTVQKVFGGVLLNSYRCKNCNTVSKRKENFTDINLALPTNSTDPISVQNLLYDFLKIENLEGDNKYDCTSCGNLQDAEKSSKFIESPSHLTCTLLRFHFDREAKRRSKIFTEISYEKTLKLPSIDGVDQEYELYCIVLHSGYGSDSGHYYCFGRKSDDDTVWYNFNDSHVSPVNFDSFQERSKKFPRDTPYVLMYQRRGVNSSGVNELEKPLRPDLKAAVEKDNRAYLMDLDRNLFKSLSSDNSKKFNHKNDEDDDDNHGYDPTRSCHAGGKFDSFGGGRFIF